jgi:hypothetical protein
MAARRHSTVQFNPSEWLADTARMPRIVRSLYFDLCCYTWETANPVPPSEVYLMISDLPEGQGEAILENLVQSGKLERREDGYIHSPNALLEAMRAYAVWAAKSRGGRGGKAIREQVENETAELDDEIPPISGLAPLPKEMKRELLDNTATPLVDSVSPEQIAESWNQLARRKGLKQIVKMTAERQNRLFARMADHGGEAILRAIERLGDNEMVLATKPTFDALLQPETCAKMIGDDEDTACGEVTG